MYVSMSGLVWRRVLGCDFFSFSFSFSSRKDGEAEEDGADGVPRLREWTADAVRVAFP